MLYQCPTKFESVLAQSFQQGSVDMGAFQFLMKLLFGVIFNYINLVSL